MLVKILSKAFVIVKIRRVCMVKNRTEFMVKIRVRLDLFLVDQTNDNHCSQRQVRDVVCGTFNFHY